jgi:hypothetical protein
VLIVVLPRRDISRWPAIILAVSRTERVMGRMRFLISSIITIRGSRRRGVPCGVR